MESPRRSGRLRRLGGALLVAVCCVSSTGACSDGTGTTTNIAYSSYDGPGVGVKIEYSSVLVEMDASVQYVSNFHSQTGQPTVQTQSINGLPFQMVTGGFTLGDHTFDGLDVGDHVLITADGILVNGERRWDFPES